MRCLDAVAFPKVKRFLRVAKWVYKAGQMLLRYLFIVKGFLWGNGGVTTILCFLPEGVSLLPMWFSGCRLQPGHHQLKIAKEGERLAGDVSRSTSAN